MAEEWGPWLEHDGKGCPCVGMYVETQRRSGRLIQGVAGNWKYHNPWDWGDGIEQWTHAKVVRYRIRKPRGLAILEGLLEHLPEKVDA